MGTSSTEIMPVCVPVTAGTKLTPYTDEGKAIPGLAHFLKASHSMATKTRLTAQDGLLSSCSSRLYYGFIWAAALAYSKFFVHIKLHFTSLHQYLPVSTPVLKYTSIYTSIYPTTEIHTNNYWQRQKISMLRRG